MKRATTIFCCLALMLYGAFIASPSLENAFSKYQALKAAPLTMVQTPNLPLKIRLNSEERQKDTITIRDTVQVTNIVYKKVPKPKCTTDTMFVPMLMPGPMESISVNKQNSGDREEHTPVLLLGSKPHSVSLTVDGQVVYDSKR